MKMKKPDFTVGFFHAWETRKPDSVLDNHLSKLHLYTLSSWPKLTSKTFASSIRCFRGLLQVGLPVSLFHHALRFRQKLVSVALR